MAAHKNPWPAPPQPERPGFVNLRFRIRLRRPQPRDHADGGGRGTVGGRGQEAAALPRRGTSPRRGGRDGGRSREGAAGDGRGGDRELSSRSPPRPRRGGGDGRRLEGGGGAGRGGDGDLWSGLPSLHRGGEDGGRRRQGAGGASRGGNKELWMGSPPPLRGWGVGGRRREGAGGAGRGDDRELSSRSPPPPRRGAGDGGRRREGAGGASRDFDVELWSGFQPLRRGWGDGGRRREEAGGAGRGGDGELSSGSLLPPRQGGGDGRRHDGGNAGRGIYGELSAGSASVGGGAAELGSGVVHTCRVCSKTFDRVKALHGHMRSCRAAADELPPSAPRQERANKHMVKKKKADDEGLLGRALERSWAVTWRRRRGRIPSHGGGEPLGPEQDRVPVAAVLREVTRRRRRRRRRTPSHGRGESRAPPAKRACVAAQDRAPVAAMLCEVTGLQMGEDDLDQPWAAEMVRAAQDLMLLSAGEAGFGLIADGQSEQSVVTVSVPPAKISKVKVPEPPSTIRNSPVVPDTDVIVIDDDDEEDVQPNSAVAEMNTSAVTIAISVPDTVETVTIAPAPDAVAAVTITAAPATPSTVAIATAPATAATAVTIEAGPDAAKGKEIAFSNGNGGGSAIAGAGEIKVYRCPKCSKTFRSYQALGGHMANHKISEKRAKELQDVKDVAAAMAAVMDGRALHVCAKCSKTFPTGQALGGHMRLHYAGQLLGAGKTTALAAPSTASGVSISGPAAAGNSSFVFTQLKQEEEPPEEMAMAGNVVPVYAPAATAFGLSLPAAISCFRLAFATPKQEEETPEVTARAHRNGARGGFRLFGVDIAEGPKEEPME